ncbi:hypothetical protein N7493_005218 [Penicillium malachiteum]|uniref:Major facilitator superfamily (MFS) profile domain-containing protein n=1 Tax=Penicillium malachiteum TaxID=1324776 RepID=A0AAD6HM92_9EURO|nr:hypothetical protein N7493_005218 [Penicillium malachiteum]
MGIELQSNSKRSCDSDPAVGAVPYTQKATVPSNNVAKGHDQVPESQPDPPPDGGWQAWLQVLGSWILIFNTWGIVVTFGDFQNFYESGQLFTQTSSKISWIGSIQAFLVFATGAVTGPIFARGQLKPLLIVGNFCLVFGHMMLSLCKEYWQALLAQGFMIGIGASCLFVPSLAVMQPYFSRHLGLAIGIAATGSSLGGVIYPVIFINLIDRLGFGWTVRIMGFVSLGTLLIPMTVSKMRVKPAGVRRLFDLSAFRDGPYLLFKSEAGIICTAIFTGFSSGIFIATPPLLFVALTKGKSKIGTRMGMAFTLLGLGVLTGGPG